MGSAAGRLGLGLGIGLGLAMARRRGARPEEGVRTTAAVEEVAWRQAAQPADAAQLVVLRLARQQRAA